MFHKPFMGFLKHFRVFQRRLKMFQCRFRESKGIKEEFRFGEFQGRSRGYQGALSGLLIFQVVLKGYGLWAMVLWAKVY